MDIANSIIGAGQAMRPALKKLFQHRFSNTPAYSPFGYAYNANGGGLAAPLSAHLKVEVEAGYEALQVAKFSNQLKAGANWKCIVAGTETSDRSTTANSYHPIVGGVAYNAMRNGSTDLYGWDAVKFGGVHPFTDTPCPNVLAGCSYAVVSNVLTVTTPAQAKAFVAGQLVSFLELANAISAGVYTLTGGSTTTAIFAKVTANTTGTCNLLPNPGISTPGIVLSDLVDSHSIPRGTTNSVDIGNTRSLVMMRTYFDGTSNLPPGDWQNILATSDTATSANRGRILQLGGSSSDAVGTLSTVFNAASDYVHPFMLIPHYRRRAISVTCVGDSTFQSTFLATDLCTSWLTRACADVSTPNKPVVPLNIGMGSGTSDMYQLRAKTLLATLKPDIAIYEAFSPNDAGGTSSQPTQMSVWDQKKKVVDFLRFCSDNNIYPILTTPLPNNNYTSGGDAFRLQVRSMVLDIASSQQVSVIDFGILIGDGATPERFNPAYNAVSSPVHQNEAGLELQAAAVAALLRQLI